MTPSKSPDRYSPSRQLIAGSDFNNVVDQLNSAVSGLTAKAGGGKVGATPLTGAVNTLAVVATNGDSVLLPKGFPGLEVWIDNAGAANAQVFGFGSDTINSVATGVGVALNAATLTIYKCMTMDPVTKIANWRTK